MKTLIVAYALLITYAPTGVYVSSSPGKVTSAEQDTVDAVNAYRKKFKLAALEIDPILMKVARARVSVYTHKHPKYGWSWEHAKAWGFSGRCTDNFAKGYDDGPNAVAGWSRDYGHAIQMQGYFKMNGQWVNYHFNKIGVAIDQRSKQCIAIFGVDDRN